MFGTGTHVLPLAGPGYEGATGFWLPDQQPTSRVGYNGAPQTIALMGKSALGDSKDFTVRQLAENVCQGLDSKDYVSEYLAGYYFLLQHTRYMRDPRRDELVRSPAWIAKQILAGFRPSIDCDDASNFLAAWVLAVGGQAWFATLAFANQFAMGPNGKPQRQYSHVLAGATDPRTATRIILDPVAAEKTGEMLTRVKAARVWPIA